MTIAKVEPLTTARALRGPFDYRIPEAMEGIEVGSVLVVPFGPRRLLGVVVGLADRSELAPERLAEPVEALEAGTPAELVRLGLWVASEYCSTPARGLALVMPPGTGPGGQRVRARHRTVAEILPAGFAALENERLGSRQRAALEALREGPLDAPALGALGADAGVIRRLAGRELIETRRELSSRRPPAPIESSPVDAPDPTADQRAAIEAVLGALEGSSGPGRELLLHGVTGSGKTEVYLAAAEAALARGRGVIVLVPEIGLTPQAVSRFSARLGDRVAVLHSGLSAGERYDEWRRLRDGSADVCVGPRSAVFAPVRDLGLLVIDEEHDSSYKQEGDPCYDARHVARRRAAEAGAVLVAGSATPRPESWSALPRLELPRRVDSRPMPPVEVVDMRGLSGTAGPLHPAALEALLGIRERGEKAIVQVSRRGFSPWLICRSCGTNRGCPDCDVSLVLHRSRGRLVCHHCGHSEPLPEACPECGSVSLAQAGAGSERIEGVLAEALDPLPVFRLDSDSAGGRGSHERILDGFRRAPAGVLVGTQMVGKGHDFPEVTLSVMVDADSALRFPDFRAEERTFAAITQLAGRSGRGEAGGRVIVQTLSPQAPSVAYAVGHDAAGFLEGELRRREALRYPPFSHLVRIGVAAADEQRLDRVACRLRDQLAPALPAATGLLGPAALFRVRGRHRRRLLLKASDRVATVTVVREVVELMASDRSLKGIAIGVDVDPQ